MHVAKCHATWECGEELNLEFVEATTGNQYCLVDFLWRGCQILNTGEYVTPKCDT